MVKISSFKLKLNVGKYEIIVLERRVYIMSLTIRYIGLSDNDIAYLREALGSHEVYLFRVGNATTLTANGNMNDMLAILAVTSKFDHQDLMLRQTNL